MRFFALFLSAFFFTVQSPAWSQTPNDFTDGFNVQNSSPDDFRAMIKAGGDVNGLLGNGDRPIHVVIYVSDAYKIGLLLDHGADVTIKSASGETPLHLAAQSTSLDPALVQRIIDAGADVNALNAEGATPYDVAEKYGAWVTRDLIAKAGGKPHKTDTAQSPQPSLADAFTDPETLSGSGDSYFQDMIAAGADVNAALPGGDRPLHIVLRAASVFKSNLLMDKGAEVSAVNDLGETPLHAAAQQDYLGPKVIERLIALGADVNAKDKAGQTPLDVANAYASWDVVAVLTSHGGVTGQPEAPAPEPVATAEPAQKSQPMSDTAVLTIDIPGSGPFRRAIREGSDTTLTGQDRAIAGGLALAVLDCPLDISADERAALAAFATSEALAAPLGHGDAFNPDLNFSLQSIFEGTMGSSAGMMAGAALGCSGDAPTLVAKRILKALGYTR